MTAGGRDSARPRRRLILISLPADAHASRFSAEKTFPTIDRTALCRLEGHRGFPTALRAHGHGLRLGETRARRTLALGLAVLAPLGFVLEVFVVEEVLFSRCKYEICTAINAL